MIEDSARDEIARYRTGCMARERIQFAVLSKERGLEMNDWMRKANERIGSTNWFVGNSKKRATVKEERT